MNENTQEDNGPWVPASNGTEVPFTHGFYRYLYMYQPSSQTHAYICLDTDMFLSDDEANRLFGGDPISDAEASQLFGY